MIYLKLFFTFFKIGLFNFGGGYAMISFIQNEVVFKNHWLTTAQFTDIVAVSQVTPGPVGINMATYTGYTAGGGTLGALVATAAVCLPPFILMLLISRYLLRYQHAPRLQRVFEVLRPTVVGLIAAAALVLCNSENFTGVGSILLFAGTFGAVWKGKVGPVWVLVISGLTGLLLY